MGLFITVRGSMEPFDESRVGFRVLKKRNEVNKFLEV